MAQDEDQPKPAEDSLQSGYFCFQNFLGDTISTGAASHWTSTTGDQVLNLDGLGQGDTSLSQPFNTSSSDIDHWNFTATLENGQTFSVEQKDCAVHSEDAGGTVTLQATASGDSGTFTIVPPKSGSCNCSFD